MKKIIFILLTLPFLAYITMIFAYEVKDMKLLDDFSITNTNTIDNNQKNLQKKDFSNSDLSKKNLRFADLTNSNFKNTILNQTDLRYTTLTGANFENATLISTNLEKADITFANFANANLKDLDLSGQDLNGVIFYNAKLINIKVDERTKFLGSTVDGVDFSGVKGLTKENIEYLVRKAAIVPQAK